ncbi:hypothetical protein CYMTET_36755 [Cymbomonas tetramitiformis]|uniref:Uncharacterized protein n=1 Tax=Cymbomonas tetramitiformis TaxID=36881 RepID=A0AAE0F7B2_9CHLO|nr:hypothetical protein CYMTET_36755 [Cymbomonas tetramitiformis]|eukprot:gene10130-11989_t
MRLRLKTVFFAVGGVSTCLFLSIYLGHLHDGVFLDILFSAPFLGRSQHKTRSGLPTAANKTSLRHLDRKASASLPNLNETVLFPEFTHAHARLSAPRFALTAVAAGQWIIFAGGKGRGGNPSRAVDLYDVESGRWSVAQLSQARYNLAGAAVAAYESEGVWVEPLALFAGGTVSSEAHATAAVDVLHLASGKWTRAKLSEARTMLAACAVRHLALFAGGTVSSDARGRWSDRVDLYDSRRGIWKRARLSSARTKLTAVAVDDRYALVAGGFGRTQYSKVVDIYDVVTGRWTASALSFPRQYLVAATIGTKAVFAGGFWCHLGPPHCDGGFDRSGRVDVWDVDGTWSVAEPLQPPRSNLAGFSAGERWAVFAGGTARVHRGDLFTDPGCGTACAARADFRQGKETEEREEDRVVAPPKKKKASNPYCDSAPSPYCPTSYRPSNLEVYALGGVANVATEMSLAAPAVRRLPPLQLQKGRCCLAGAASTASNGTTVVLLGGGEVTAGWFPKPAKQAVGYEFVSDLVDMLVIHSTKET